MTYREPPLFEFSRLGQLACFTGKNGNGKSALMDAFTWALWGDVYNRKPSGVRSKVDQTLLTTGQTHMQVEAVFVHEDETFKVIRSYSCGGAKEKRTLDIHCAFNDSWRSISSDYPSLNEAEILQKIVPVSYTTFINTAYLVQGKYDEFTKRTPTNRRNVILPLIVDPMYDIITKHALTVKRELETRETALGEKIAAAQHILDTFGEITSDLQTVEETLAEVQKSKAKSAAEIQHLSELYRDLESRYADEQMASENIVATQEKQAQLTANLTKSETRLMEIQDILNELEIREANYLEYQQHESTLTRLTDIERSYSKTLLTSEQKTNAIKTTLAQKQQQAALLHARLENITTILATESEIRAGYDEYLAIHAEYNELNKKQILYTRAMQTRTQIESDIRAQYHGKLGQIQALRTQLGQMPLKDTVNNALVSIIEAQTAWQSILAEEPKALKALEDTRNKITNLRETALQKQVNVGIGDVNYEQVIRIIRNVETDTENTCCPVCLHHFEGIDSIRHLYEHAEQLKTHDDRVRKENEVLRNTIRKLAQKEEELNQLIAHIDHAKRDLEQAQRAQKTHEERLRLIEDFEQHIISLTDECSQEHIDNHIQAATQHIDNEIESIGFSQEHQDELRTLLLEKAHLVAKIQKLDEAHEQLKQFKPIYDNLEIEIHKIEQCIESGDHIRKEQEQCARLQHEALQHGCTIENIHTFRTELEHRRDIIIEQYQQLQTALSTKETVQQHIESLQQQLQLNNTMLIEVTKKADNLEATKHSMIVVGVGKTAEEKDYKQYEEQEKDLLTQKGRLQTRLDIIEEKKREQKQLYEELMNIQHDLLINTYLTEICGHDGLQTTLLKQNIGAFNYEANEILRRITDDTTYIVIETDKRLKSGDNRDTFDIKIVTDGISRYYEGYSGGQKFRIDLALRVGISKVLARQAGSPLETLIIDEGFGTQDDTSLLQVVQALTAIQEDFKHIIIITHIEKLQALFDSRVHFELHPVKGTQFIYL